MRPAGPLGGQAARWEHARLLGSGSEGADRRAPPAGHAPSIPQCLCWEPTHQSPVFGGGTCGRVGLRGEWTGQGVTVGVTVPGDERVPAPVLDLPGCRPSPTSCYSSGTWAEAPPQSLRAAHAGAAVQPRPQAHRPTGALQEPSLSPVLVQCWSQPLGSGGPRGQGWVVVHASGGLHSQTRAATTFCVCRQTENQSISGLSATSLQEKSAPQPGALGGLWVEESRPRLGEVQSAAGPGFQLCGCREATVPALPLIQGPAAPAVASRGRTSPASRAMCRNRLTSFSGSSLVWQWPAR